ncbi:BlaI/MecI/CopY family transcriptional regulator [Microcoleus sp.]|uniref:BlaI/MecI/CopY family transcriptional regulator n=1 Tax=Microcoleus sp. TaxID=44472 RepID=UPI00359489F5
MNPLPNYRPKQLSLGPLEAEILNIVWELEIATVKDVHDRILADPDRELAYASVTTVLRRLTDKGWLVCNKSERTFTWQPLVSGEEARSLFAYDRLQKFLAVGNPDIVAAFADSLDQATVEQLQEISLRIQAVRQAREEQK